MATKSILKSIHVKNRKSAEALVCALENAKGKRAKQVQMSKVHSTASREEIRKMFGDADDRL